MEEHWQPPGAGRDKDGVSPWASGGSKSLPAPLFLPTDTDFRLLASRSVREQISVVLKQQICGNLLQDTNIPMKTEIKFSHWNFYRYMIWPQGKVFHT